MQRMTIVENVFWHTHKQFHLSQVTVADLDSSDSSRFYLNERYRSERYASIKFNTYKLFARTPKEIFTSKIENRMYVAHKIWKFDFWTDLVYCVVEAVEVRRLFSSSREYIKQLAGDNSN